MNGIRDFVAYLNACMARAWGQSRGCSRIGEPPVGWQHAQRRGQIRGRPLPTTCLINISMCVAPREPRRAHHRLGSDQGWPQVLEGEELMGWSWPCSQRAVLYCTWCTCAEGQFRPNLNIQPIQQSIMGWKISQILLGIISIHF